MRIRDLSSNLVTLIRDGVVIPAHPLALDDSGRLDEQRQRALTRYYVDSGAGGVAIGVHTTQFAIRDSDVRLFEPVLRIGAETVDECCRSCEKEVAKIAGLCGRSEQAMREAERAVELGSHAGLLSLAAFKDDEDSLLIDHCRTISKVIPIVGFYLQPAVGGRVLGYEFWRQFAEIENVLAIKIAPFNRYQTLDVVRAVCEAGREDEIALYTGNDDNIVVDMLTPFQFVTDSGIKTVHMVGGLLGHWAVWTRKAVEQLETIKSIRKSEGRLSGELLRLNAEVTDANAAFFDAANKFSGCIPGIHEVLRRQGLLSNVKTLDPREVLTHEQSKEIDRVCAAYPHLSDDDFVEEHLAKWLS